MAEDAILGFLQSNGEITDSHDFAAGIGIDHAELENVIKRLNGFQIVDALDFKKDNYLLTEEGKLYAVEGSPEVKFFLSVPPEAISLANLKAKLDRKVFSIGSSWSKKNNWIEIAKGSVTRKVEVVEDKVKDLLNRIEDGKSIDGNDAAELLKRKLIVKQTWRGYKIRKGRKYVSKRKKAATDLTREHLQKGDWKDLEFKEYNLNAQAQPIQIGYLQPLLEDLRYLFN